PSGSEISAIRIRHIMEYMRVRTNELKSLQIERKSGNRISFSGLFGWHRFWTPGSAKRTPQEQPDGGGRRPARARICATAVRASARGDGGLPAASGPRAKAFRRAAPAWEIGARCTQSPRGRSAAGSGGQSRATIG